MATCCHSAPGPGVLRGRCVLRGAATEYGVRMVEEACQTEHYRREILRSQGRAMGGDQTALEWIDQYAAGFLS